MGTRDRSHSIIIIIPEQVIPIPVIVLLRAQYSEEPGSPQPCPTTAITDKTRPTWAIAPDTARPQEEQVKYKKEKKLTRVLPRHSPPEQDGPEPPSSPSEHLPSEDADMAQDNWADADLH